MPNKYRNKSMRIDGIYFPSQREGAEYVYLKWRQKAGEISHLSVHPKFLLMAEGVSIGHYVADFIFRENGKQVVVDVKSPPTRTPFYRWKTKHLRAQYPHIDLREVF